MESIKGCQGCEQVGIAGWSAADTFPSLTKYFKERNGCRVQRQHTKNDGKEVMSSSLFPIRPLAPLPYLSPNRRRLVLIWVKCCDNKISTNWASNVRSNRKKKANNCRKMVVKQMLFIQPGSDCSHTEV